MKNPSPRLPIDSCESLFEKLKFDYSQFQNDWTSTYFAFNFIITAYHLYQDWINKSGTKEQMQRKELLSPDGKKLFEVLRDITNATKHFSLFEKNQQKQIAGSISGPIIGDWAAYFFHGPVLYVTVGNSRPNFVQISKATISCFNWILNGEKSNLDEELQALFSPIQPSP